MSFTNNKNNRIQFIRFMKSDLQRNKIIYMMVLPALLYYIIFHYLPMYGAQIAFRNFSPAKGILQSTWIGFDHFRSFFNSYYFWRLLKNTILLNVWDILLGFPAPIILALMLNEIRVDKFKRFAQTVTYMPRFISMVVICGLILDFTSREGLFNNILNTLGIESIPFMILPDWFRPIYAGSGIWQMAGWNSIIYLAALTRIDPQLYEAAEIDGAGRWKKILHITIPGILPIIIIMLILRLGQLMGVGGPGMEKVLLLYNSITYETADIISTFVYRKGVLEASYSYSTAIGLFNSVINFSLLVAVNKMSKKFTETSLW